MARVSGAPYTEYVRQQILEPLAMTGTTFDPLPEELLERRATGYAARFLSDELEPASIPPAVWAEGGLWSSVEDLARWISFQLREDAGARAGGQVLAGSTLKEMHTPRYLGNEEWTEAWCVAWYAIRKDDVTWVQHSGGIHGFTTCACFDPKEKVGAIALLNGVGDAEGLAMGLGKMARDAVVAAASMIESPASMPETFRPLLGIYLNPEQGLVVRLEWRDGKLVFVDPSEPSWHPALAPTDDPDVFIVEPGVRESGEPATFRRTPDGRVASVHLASETLVRVDPVR